MVPPTPCANIIPHFFRGYKKELFSAEKGVVFSRPLSLDKCISQEYNIFINDAGWSSLEARRAHNPKVIGSNPVPATKRKSYFEPTPKS